MRQARTFCWVLVAFVLLGTIVAGGVSASPPNLTAADMTPESTITGDKSASGVLAQTDPSLLGQTGSALVNVMIKYDYDATASYAGGVSGLAATSPSVTGKPLKENKAAVQAYDQHAQKFSNQVSAAIEKAVPTTDINQTYITAYGGVAAQIPANRVADVLHVDGVTAVQKDSLNQPLDDNTDFIGAKTVWPSLGGSSTAGKDVIFGDIDTGVWPENPMLSPAGVSSPTTGNPPWACQFGDGTDVANLGQPSACNNKLIGAYAFTNTYLALHGSDGQEFCDDVKGVCSARDSEGHGTHTTTTAAGSCASSALLYGVQRGPVCGIAPGAHVIEYRVCLSAGCFSSDSVAAVNQAITDGVNVINFSISGGANPYTDPVELAFLDAFHAGISVNASAGNSGPGAGTSDHGGPWVTTVGASTGPRFFTTTLHLTADGGATFDIPGVTVTNGISTPTPVVLAQNLPGEDALCQSTLGAGTATGQIVMCQRGTNGRIDKGRRVADGDAAGMILYNAIKQDVETDNHYLPAIHVDGPATALLAFVNGHTNVRATWSTGTASATTPDVMATFSSRGPTGDFVKPDVTAPGIQVLAGTTPQPDQTTADNGPPGNLFMAIAGTSMSSPHAAGVSILVKAAHPDWTPSEIKSALMTSSVQSVVKEDGVTPADPFDDGAGSIRADRAVNPTLVFDENYDDYANSATDPLHRIDLNLPSVDAPTMSGLITTRRTATNVTGVTQPLQVRTVAPPGVTISVSDRAPGANGPKASDTIVLKGKGTTDIWITISAPDVATGQYFGRITLQPQTPGLNGVVIPVAFRKTQGTVALTNTCSPASFAVSTGTSHCAVTAQNLGSVPAATSITVAARENGAGLKYRNVGAPGVLIAPDKGVQWNGTLSPALAPPVNSLTLGGGEPYGYFPLTTTPNGPTGDETAVNFATPTFMYGGEPYSRIGVVSDGYVVIGGVNSAADIQFQPRLFPNAAPPNNVVAPIWTDLNPAFGGAIRVNSVSDGVSTWIIVDFAAVRNYSDPVTHRYEVWIRLGSSPSSEQISMVYSSTANAGTGDSGLAPGLTVNWGAENRDGTSGQNLASAPANGTTYSVDLSSPIPGGSVSIPFDVTGNNPGTFHSDASMTSDRTPGQTIATQTLTVTP